MTTLITRPRSQLWTPATRPSHLRPRYPQLHDGMVLWACPTFGTAGNRLLDVSGYGNHGDMVNMDWTTDVVAGPHGSLALVFDGSSSYVEIPNGIITDYPFAFSCWVLVRSLSTQAGLISTDDHPTNYNGASLLVQTDGRVHLLVGDGDGAASGNRQSAATTGQITLGQAHHIAVSARAYMDVSIWIDGVQQYVTYSGGGNLFRKSTYTGSIGRWNTAATRQLDGDIAEAIIYDRTVSDGEVKLLSRRPLIAGEAIRRPMVSVPADVGGGFNPAWAMNATVVAGVNCA